MQSEDEIQGGADGKERTGDDMEPEDTSMLGEGEEPEKKVRSHTYTGMDAGVHRIE